MKTFTAEEVAKHNKAGDCWIIIEGKVFDLSKFLSEHPGGSKVVLKVAGMYDLFTNNNR
jgi:cytochrome b involved in lipid metabolism